MNSDERNKTAEMGQTDSGIKEINLNEFDIFSLQYDDTRDIKAKNVLLLTLSTLQNKEEIPQSSYSYDEYKVKGYGQLEPVPKVLAQMLQKDKENLDVIIVLASEATQKILDTPLKTIPEEEEEQCSYSGISALKFFVYQLHHDEACKNTRFLYVDSDDIKTALSETVEELRRIHEKNRDMNLYVDMHGGPRQYQLLVDAILSLLKMDGINVKDAFNVSGGGKGRQISNVMDSIQIFDFVAGMNEFISYGYGTGIQRYINQSDSNKEEEEFAGYIKDISDSLALCRINEFENALDKLNVFLESKENSLGSYFGIFVKSIKNDYKDLLNKDERTLIKEIEWAQRKGFYQQCLAIVESKTPEYFCNNFLKNEQNGYIRIKKGNEIVAENDFYEEHKKYCNENKMNFYSGILLYCHSNQKKQKIKFGIYQNNKEIEIRIENYKPERGKGFYNISFFTKMNDKKCFEDFMDSWSELKTTRNNVMHLNEDKEVYSVDDVNKSLNTYLEKIKKLTADLKRTTVK